MSYYLLISLIVFHLNAITISSYDYSKLKLVLIIHRHGDRAPHFTYPTDLYASEDYWPQDFAQLTNKGKERMFQLGKYIRERYKKFLGTSPREVHIRSSEVERCLESVSLVIAGLYPPKGMWQWNDSLGKLWQPVPIHTMNVTNDGMLNPSSICPMAEEESDKILNSNTVRNFMQKRKLLLEFVSENSGLDMSHYKTAKDLFSTLEIQKSHNYSLPKWVNNTVFESLREIHDIAFYFEFSTQLVQRLRSGLLLKDMTNRMTQSIVEFKYKIHFYSTHDTQMTALLNALKIFNMKSPPFGAALFFELYKIGNKDILQLHYLNVTESQNPYPIDLTECSNEKKECLLNEFLDSVKDLIPNNWEHECNAKLDSKKDEL